MTRATPYRVPERLGMVLAGAGARGGHEGFRCMPRSRSVSTVLARCIEC
jgi:hypothetical protein